MISRRQIIKSQQKLNAQRYLLEQKQHQQQQNANNPGVSTTRAQNSRQAALTTKLTDLEDAIGASKGSNKTRHLAGKSKQFAVGQQEYNMNLAQDIRRFNKCFHEDNHYPREDVEEEIDDDDDEIENDQNDDQEEDNVDEDDEDEFRAQEMRQHLRSSNHTNCNDLHEDYRHFDPYSVYGEEDEEEDVWYSEERLFEVSFIVQFSLSMISCVSNQKIS